LTDYFKAERKLQDTELQAHFHTQTRIITCILSLA